MEIEKAVYTLGRLAHTEAKWPGTEESLEALDMAIKALRATDTHAADKDSNVPTNADRIRAMGDQGLAAFLERISIGGDEPWEVAFKAAFCDRCPTVEATDEDGKHYHLVECDFEDGVCPHGRSIPWWLRQPQTE